MAIIPLTPTDPDILESLPDYTTGSAIDFATRLQDNQDALEARDEEVMAAVEGVAGAIGFGWLSGGAITAGSGLSVNVAALTAIVGTPVGFTTSQVVAVNASVTNYIFLRQDWTWTVPAAGSSTVPLSSDGHGAALLWGTATCDGSGVTSVSNVRKSFLQQLSRMPLLTADPTDASSGDVWGRTDTTTIHVQGLGTFSTSGGGGSGNWSYIGDYDNAHTYALNDVVIGADGLGYIAKGSTVGHAPPNATYWKPLGTKGDTGATGPTGPTGPAGAQGFTNLGSWSSGTGYVPYDVVEYNGSTYQAIASGTNKNPATESAYWQLMAAKGDTGATGADGADGADGAQWLVTTGIPGSGTGNDGDWAVDPASWDVFRKSAGSWGYEGNIRGAQGTQGLQGASRPLGLTICLCSGFTPAGTGADSVEFPVPYDLDGSTVIAWTVKRITLRVKVAGGSPAIKIQKSSAGNATFGAGTDIGTLSLGSGDYKASGGSSLGSVASGNDIRFNVTTLGSATGWTITVELAQ